MEDVDLRDFLKHLAVAGAREILPLFANPDLHVEWKADDTPVTYADRKAEEVMRAIISREFPDHGIIGEEHGSVNPDATYTWVLDPIDGTRSFAAGCPLFGTLICLRRGTHPIWGAINLPVTGQLFTGNNAVAWCNDRVITLPTPPPLSACFLSTTDPKSPAFKVSGRQAGWQRLLAATGQYRSWGDCYGYTLLLNGGIHIMTDPIMNLWDLVALLPILRGAGAEVSDWRGADPALSDSLVAAHPDIHAQVIQLLDS